MYKVTFGFLGKPKVLCCKKLEEGPHFFNTLIDIVRNPEVVPNAIYSLNSNNLMLDSYEEFQDRKFVRVPINHILLIEQFDLKKIKNFKMIENENVHKMPV